MTCRGVRFRHLQHKAFSSSNGCSLLFLDPCRPKLTEELKAAELPRELVMSFRGDETVSEALNRVRPEGDSDDDAVPGSRSHTGVNPTMMNPGFGNSASHPLGWSGTGPKRSTPEGNSEVPQSGAFGWAEMAFNGAYKDFLQAAAQVPEAMPRPVPLHHDLRVVLHVPPNSPVSAELEIVSVKEETTAKPVQRPGIKQPTEPEVPQGTEDYDGACGVIVSPGEDARGRWMVEATRKGVTHILRVPGYGLLWQGAPVLVTVDGEEKEAGLLAAERPDRSTGLWLVEIHKTLALLPANLRERSLPGFEEEGRSTQLPLVRGVAVELCNLRAGAAYNGLSGVVLSTGPNPRGRWEVAVKVPMHVARERFILVGAGDAVELRGLKSAPQHNGKCGTLLQQVPSKSGSEMRWRVKCGDIMLDLKEANLFKPCMVDENEPSCPPLPGDGSDGRMPPMFRSSLERAKLESDCRHLGPRRGGHGVKRRREAFWGGVEFPGSSVADQNGLMFEFDSWICESY
eukprot:symbB.v1.2.006928.t1/scaffold400.1/size211454/7